MSIASRIKNIFRAKMATVLTNKINELDNLNLSLTTINNEILKQARLRNSLTEYIKTLTDVASTYTAKNENFEKSIRKSILEGVHVSDAVYTMALQSQQIAKNRLNEVANAQEQIKVIDHNVRTLDDRRIDLVARKDLAKMNEEAKKMGITLDSPLASTFALDDTQTTVDHLLREIETFTSSKIGSEPVTNVDLELYKASFN